MTNTKPAGASRFARNRASPPPPAETVDEVVKLAARLRLAIDRDEALQESRARPAWFESIARDAFDEVGAIGTMIAMTKATTIPGAAVQIAVATSLVQRVLDTVPDGFETGALRLLFRLLYSAFGVLERLPDVEAIGAGDFGEPHLNPWRSVEETLAALADKPMS